MILDDEMRAMIESGLAMAYRGTHGAERYIEAVLDIYGNESAKHRGMVYVWSTTMTDGGEVARYVDWSAHPDDNPIELDEAEAYVDSVVPPSAKSLVRRCGPIISWGGRDYVPLAEASYGEGPGDAIGFGVSDIPLVESYIDDGVDAVGTGVFWAPLCPVDELASFAHWVHDQDPPCAVWSTIDWGSANGHDLSECCDWEHSDEVEVR